MEIRNYQPETDANEVLELYNNNFTRSKWTLKDIKHIYKKRNIFLVLQDNKGDIVGVLSGIKTKSTHDKNIAPYFIGARDIIIISDIISIVKNGGSSLIDYIKNMGLPLYLTAINIETMGFYIKNGFVRVKPLYKKDHRLSMCYYLNDTERLINRMKTIVIFKGNPKYEINKKITNKFYKDIVDIVIEVYGDSYKYNLKTLDSGKKYPELCETLKDGDVVIGHSRGGSYASIFKKFCNSDALFIAIGADDYTDNSVLITNDNDKVLDNDFNKKSIYAHWEMSLRMKDRLTDELRKYRDLTDI